ncbi:magnesium/cobalt transporter CorA [Marispirochaeta aestuarii]|uniref:magnesium/cobalt transporter CorA n=1 Tax=Marispirochaeta aestuarii TaxID=1963862 RepID=UPI0029C63125|nr:magnesium/cobalt transporter CorA [Marispirochaeta aestuarii]
MKRFVKLFSRRIGTAPGSIIDEPSNGSQPVEMGLFRYNADSVEQRQLAAEDSLEDLAQENRILWLDIPGVHDSVLLKRVARRFDIHPIAAENIQHTGQRPKADEYGEQLFLLLHMLTWNGQDKTIETEQVSIISGKGYVISFQEHPGDVFDPVRRRISEGLGRVRRMGADYLSYSLADAVVDNYFLVLEDLQEEFEKLEEQVLFEDGPDPSAQVHSLTRELLSLRRAVWPMREAASSLMRGQVPAISEDVQIFFRDLHDHVVQIIDWIELMRDSLKGLMDSYQSRVGNSTNAIMRVLTIVATIFIPLTFIVGIYGMNFQRMPELSWPLGYPLVMALMAMVALGMLFYFKKKKWL